MSSAFTLHVAPHAAPGDPRALERAELVRDGFSWGAFLAPALWLFWHRHWLAGLAAAVLVFGLAAGLAALGTRPGAIVLAELLLHLLFGLEGASLRRFALARRHRPTVDVVIASDMAEAEAKSFGRWLAPATVFESPTIAPATVPSVRRANPVPPRSAEPIIGLFPDREGRR